MMIPQPNHRGRGAVGLNWQFAVRGSQFGVFPLTHRLQY
jgi:hypothetical protein